LTSLLLRLAKQWIAGERAEDGINRVREANSRGILGLLNLLGEHIENREQIQSTVQEYIRLLELIDENHVSAQISVKPSQMGVALDSDYCFENFLKIAEACKSHSNNYLWLDMEDSKLTQKTLDLYVSLLKRYENTGLAIQAYLKRSETDLKYLMNFDCKIRLVKGAYNEPASIAFKGKEEIRKSYERLMSELFTNGRSGMFIAVATHDSRLVDFAKSLSKECPSVPYEYEMLLGVRDNLKLRLVREGYQVREYVPYGPQWLPYSIRRLREKKSNIFLLLRSLVTG
jgi:proline dehydrogenase